MPSGSRRTRVVLDLAAGTGKLTRQLVPRFARVLAVEPLEGMREVLERVVPEAEALGRHGGRDPARGRAVDAVFVGEAFHWFATDAVRCAELARVLRPRGTLAILFNQADGDFEPPLPEAFWEAYRAARDREAARADGPHRALEGAVPRAVRAARRGELPEPGRARPRGRAGAGGVVEHDRGAAGAGAGGAARAARRARCPTACTMHPLRTRPLLARGCLVGLGEAARCSTAREAGSGASARSSAGPPPRRRRIPSRAAP